MGTLIQFEIRRLPRLRLIGKEIRYAMQTQRKGENRLPAFWNQCFAEQIFAPLEAQQDQLFSPDYVGVMLDFQREDGDFSYIVGMLMLEGARVPQGYSAVTLDETEVAVGYIKGGEAQVCGVAHRLTQAALEARGRTCAQMTWCMELYNCPRFTTPDENGDVIVDYYIPLDA